MPNLIPIHLPFLILYFSFGWAVSIKTRKFAWIDVFWVSSFIPLTLHSLFAVWSWPQVLLLMMYLIWSYRLSRLLFRRVYGKKEDSRYVTLKNYWQNKAPFYLYLLYLAEGLLVLLLFIPVYLQAQSTQASLDGWNLFGALLFSLFLLGETLADSQRDRFRRNSTGPKKEVCNIGLWKYSRHPNYFFEILIWYSFAVYNFSLDQNLLSFLPAITMNLLIWKVTGVPPSQRQALESRGNAYREYMKKTNVLIPWIPKES